MDDKLLAAIIGALGTMVGAFIGRSDFLDKLIRPKDIKNLQGTWKATWLEKNQQGELEEQTEQLIVTKCRGTHVYGRIDSEAHSGKPCDFEGVFTGRFLQLLWSPGKESKNQLIQDYGCYFLELQGGGTFKGQAVGFFYHLNRTETFDVTFTKTHS